MQEINGSFPVW